MPRTAPPLGPLLGVLWLALCFLGSWRAFSAAAPPVAVEPGAVPTPTAAYTAPDAAPRLPPPARVTPSLPTGSPAYLGTAPDPRYWRPPTPAPQRNPLPPRARLPAAARSDSRPHAPRVTIAPSEPDDAEVEAGARCLLCKKPAYSWIEVDGRRHGYCITHQGRAERGSVPIGTTTDPASERPQCLAVTRKGAQCRRKAEQASYYCYQHRR